MESPVPPRIDGERSVNRPSYQIVPMVRCGLSMKLCSHHDWTPNLMAWLPRV